jgi:preprotein translocase subunit SecG
MGFLIGLLTVVMVLDCLVLMFLVLIQLPKKEAGAGLAFGGQATDALFGAGSGNVLTKITKYAAATFFSLAVVLSLMQSYYHGRTTSAASVPFSRYAGGASASDHPTVNARVASDQTGRSARHKRPDIDAACGGEHEPADCHSA